MISSSHVITHTHTHTTLHHQAQRQIINIIIIIIIIPTINDQRPTLNDQRNECMKKKTNYKIIILYPLNEGDSWIDFFFSVIHFLRLVLLFIVQIAWTWKIIHTFATKHGKLLENIQLLFNANSLGLMLRCFFSFKLKWLQWIWHVCLGVCACIWVRACVCSRNNKENRQETILQIH